MEPVARLPFMESYHECMIGGPEKNNNVPSDEQAEGEHIVLLIPRPRSSARCSWNIPRRRFDATGVSIDPATPSEARQSVPRTRRS